MQQQPPMPQDEAQEYLAKLQQGKIQIPPEASPIEHQIAKTMAETSKRIRELTTAKSDAERDAERIKQALDNIEKQIAAVEGQLGAYASLLVTAEGERRKAAAMAPQIEGATNGSKEDKADQEKGSKAKGAGKAEDRKEAGAPKKDNGKPLASPSVSA